MKSVLRTIYRLYPFKRGRGRLLEFVRRRLSGKMLFVTPSQDTYLLDLDNLIDCLTYLDGSYETDELLALERVGAKHGCDCFIDVGANIGTYSLHFSRNPAFQELWAFEPDPRNYAQFSANLWLNQAANRVRLFKTALSSKKGHATFYMNKPERAPGGPQFNTGTSSLVRDTPHHRPITVETARLDDLIALRGRRVLVKIDVEGAEHEVLQGAIEFLESNFCVVMVEMWDDPSARVKTEDLLTRCGYVKEPWSFGVDNFLFIGGLSSSAPPLAAASQVTA